METISLRFDAEEREMLRKQHIKHELLDYRYYLDKAKWLKEKITLLDERLNGGIVTRAFRCLWDYRHKGRLDRRCD